MVTDSPISAELGKLVTTGWDQRGLVRQPKRNAKQKDLMRSEFIDMQNYYLQTGAIQTKIC
jgi:hypothetical protein